MTLVNSEYRGYSNGKRVIRGTVISNTTPSPLPTNGANVIGMSENEIFAPFSILYVVGNGDVYIANEDGEFVKQ